MKSNDSVGVTFVNAVIGRGVLNGVVNVQMGVLTFESDAEGKVSGELAVACRLRMDVKCAEELRDSLDAVLKIVEEAKAKGMATVGNGADHAAEGKPN